MPARLLASAAVLAVLALAGCSADDGTSTASPSPSGSSSGAASSPGSGSPGSAGTSSGGSAATGAAGRVTCEYPATPGKAARTVSPPPARPAETGQVPVTIQTTQGDLHATLDADAAPCTVNSFLSLAEQGYYDDTPCHRLTTGGFYILQCGDPTGTGTGGPGYRFADELSGSERYPAGTLAMANNGADTNGSQFFVVYGDTPIGPQYTVFGRVDDAAVRTLTTIARAGTDNSFGPGDGHPKKAVTITSVTVD